MPVENEIKLRIADAESAARRIATAGYTVLHPRVHEMNVVCDTSGQMLRGKRSLLRVRRAGDATTVTFKGPPQGGLHKTREEIEFTASNADAVLSVLDRLGFTPVFRYEKYRTEYRKSGEPGILTVDETPIGCFLELEGPASWLDEAARGLGFAPGDYITESYGALYLQYRREHGTSSQDMLFESTK
jgi:adenylate cyclase class 2